MLNHRSASGLGKTNTYIHSAILVRLIFSETPTPTYDGTCSPTPTATTIPTEPTPEPLQHAWYAYDGDGNMVKGIVNNTVTFYPGRHYNKEVKGIETRVQKFYFVIGQTIAVRTLQNANDTLQWILSDHLGSASTTANEDGSRNSTIQYTAFGEIRNTLGITPTKYRYTGQLAQAELGLDYYVARFYDPYLNRWVQPDSIIPDVANSADFDRYSYTRNNPVRFTDSSGHCVDGITTVACLLIIGAVVLKVVDYGWTAYDIYHDGQIIADPNSSQAEKDAAEQDMAMAVAFEAAEPDDLFPVALPADDLIRKGIITAGKEVGEKAGEQAFRKFTATNFRENLKRLTGKTTEDIAEKEAHHVLPQKFSQDFLQSGLDINDPKFGSWVDQGVHQTWSKKYNDEWAEFFEKKPKKPEILDFARRKAKEYEFEINFD